MSQGKLMSQENMGRVFLQQETTDNRRRGLLLTLEALISLGRAGGLAASRQVNFR